MDATVGRSLSTQDKNLISRQQHQQPRSNQWNYPLRNAAESEQLLVGYRHRGVPSQRTKRAGMLQASYRNLIAFLVV